MQPGMVRLVCGTTVPLMCRCGCAPEQNFSGTSVTQQPTWATPVQRNCATDTVAVPLMCRYGCGPRHTLRFAHTSDKVARTMPRNCGTDTVARTMPLNCGTDTVAVPPLAGAPTSSSSGNGIEPVLACKFSQRNGLNPLRELAGKNWTESPTTPTCCPVPHLLSTQSPTCCPGTHQSTPSPTCHCACPY
jgi:hypothetical protein